MPNLQWQLLLFVALATGVVSAWQSHPGARGIVTAFVTVICVVWGSWLLYWAVLQLAPTLWQPPIAGVESPLQSHSISADIIILALVSCVVVPLGALVGAVSSLLVYGLQCLERQVRRLLSMGVSAPSSNSAVPVTVPLTVPLSVAVSAVADPDQPSPASAVHSN